MTTDPTRNDGSASALSIVFAGGGTAGHISPMISMARAVQRQQPDARITMIGTSDGLETDLVPAAGFDLELIPKVPMPRRLNTDLFALPVRLRSAIREAAKILAEKKTDVVVGVGGYVSTPVYLAARRAQIPVVVHEGNMRPGLANKVGCRFAAFVGTAFPHTPLAGAQYVGMPMRPEITGLERAPEAARQARLRLGLEPDRTTLIVTGGSSGALNLNKTVAKSAADILASGNHQILHLTGKGKQVINEDTGEPLQLPGYQQVEYIDGLEQVYLAADLVVARSGAGTVCELAAVGLPAILVPLPIGNGEQKLNGQPLVKAGGALMVEDAEFTSEWAVNHIVPLLQDAERRQQMAASAHQLGRRDADQVMARHIINLATTGTDQTR